MHFCCHCDWLTCIYTLYILMLNHMHLRQHKEQDYLLVWSVFSISLLIARMVFTETLEFRFMAVNLFLAWIPYWAAIATQKLSRSRVRFLIPVTIFIWLIFLPNAPYMITDIFHLHKYPSIPMWFDLIMLLSFALTGMLLGFFSLRKILHLFRKYSMLTQLSSVYLLFALCGVGIYLGRYLRWNSWEIVTQPGVLLSELWVLFQDPIACLQMFLLSLIFAIFFTLIFSAFFLRTEPGEK